MDRRPVVKELELLIALAGARRYAPEGLLFWLRHCGGSGTVASVWAACPRPDWMLWIAELVGVDGMDLERARVRSRAVLEEVAADLATNWIAGADSVRAHISYECVTRALRRLGPREIAA
jgi:hypothetical protein